MRTQNSVINLLVSWITQILNIILQFALRTVFIQVLSAEYLGLNGLFSNILSFLSFAELGFGSAITFSLYKPLSENDEKTVAGIMNFFKRVYFAVSIFVLVAGISITPFLPYLVSDIPDIPHISFIYILWVINSAASYFLVYKSTLILADQRKDIVDKNNIIFKVLQLCLQAYILIVTRNYILYLVAQIVMTVCSNISISIIADKRFNYLKRYKKERIKDNVLSEIKRNVGATILHKAGAVVIFGTDNVLLSKFFGLFIVGLYSNYYLIINTLTNLTGQIQSSIIASVGNLGAVGTYEKKLKVFESYCFINFWIFSFTSACLASLLDPFIKFWIGEQYTLQSIVVWVLVFNYFLTGFRSAAATFNNAFGLFWNTRKLPVIESLFNIVFSIVFASMFGYIGIFLGTTISSLITGAWFEPYILYKEGFKYPVSKYYKQMFEYFCVTFIVSVICIFVINLISVNDIIGLIIKFITAGLLSNILLFLIYCRTNRISNIYNLVQKVCKMLQAKRKGEVE